jgi:hypothetical protein
MLDNNKWSKVIRHNHQKMKVQDLSKLNLRPSPGFSKISFESNAVENSRKRFYFMTIYFHVKKIFQACFVAHYNDIYSGQSKKSSYLKRNLIQRKEISQT